MEESTYEKQLEEIKRICEDQKDKPELLKHKDEMLEFIKKNVYKLKK